MIIVYAVGVWLAMNAFIWAWIEWGPTTQQLFGPINYHGWLYPKEWDE